ncbi:hypothetical protein LTS18_003701 [Coniosporium uncinatum]|uniref:Uncharacterized protein n=1 Tax=Coniosporium uncinatum TaxID=93489 RepID=A0ACC3DTB1_9PEZI|nr:hypothetical protein LTS18_003701 [Coniosporium uncinatum]
MVNKISGYEDGPPGRRSFFRTYLKYVSKNDLQQDQHTCAICMKDFRDDSKIVQLPCGHPYCEECIVTWLKEKGRHKCPYCNFVCFIKEDHAFVEWDSAWLTEEDQEYYEEHEEYEPLERFDSLEDQDLYDAVYGPDDVSNSRWARWNR